ncbi:MAG: hypothetical protein P8168_06725 [Deltaproteobacteria bacterium]
MSVRYLAEELYRWTRKVEDLEKALGTEASMPDRVRLETELRQARQELARVRSVLDSKKETPKI